MNRDLRHIAAPLLVCLSQLLVGASLAEDAAANADSTPTADTTTVTPAAEANTAPNNQPRPPWMTEEVMRAALAMQLTPEQQGPFRTIVGEFLTSVGAMVQQEMRRESGNFAHNVKRKTKYLANDMDEKLKPVLTEQQWPAYKNYREVLLESMRRPQRG